MNTFFFDDVQYPEGLFGGKDFFNPIIYSTEEREVGVWTDGKPLYQKTFERNLTLPSATWVVTGDSIPNGQVVKSEATKIDSISDSILTWGKIGSDGHIELINIRPVGSVTISHYTMWYTKTTDVAGSGQYTTLGIPAVHYDGNEKVVGTWFGETLYEKTFVWTLAQTVQDTTITIDTFEYNQNIKNYSAMAIELGVNYLIPYIANNAYALFIFRANGNIDFIVYRTSFVQGTEIRLTIQYTKTS